MKQRWGASPEDWAKFKSMGIQADLLPVVSNPNAAVASYSTMQAIGKTPSQYNNQAHVIGIGKWTAKKAHPREIEAWAAEPDYGICIQTRHVRALDIDVDDREQALEIRDFVADWVGIELPIRYRADSGKCLLAFVIEGEIGKRTVKTTSGMIEFLANGQQFIAAGTHPKGQRYEWNWGKHKQFPVFTLDAFNDLWFALCEEFGTEKPTERGVRGGYEYDGEHQDDVSNFLIEHGHGMGQGNDGQIFIDCPFKDGHSTGDNATSTAYFPAGSGGYDRGHFVCLHASCSGRHDDEFLDAYGLREKDFDMVEIPPEEAALEPPKYAVDKHGRPKATLYNLRLALERPEICGVMPKYDQFRDEIIFYREDGKNWRRESDEIFIELRMRLESVHQFYEIGREKIRDAVLWVAKRNQVDTATEWLNAQKWDGKPRIEKFLSDYMGCDDTPYTKAVALYLWTGLAGRILEPGLKADMIPVLKSPEGYKKSSAIEALAPTPDEFVEIDFSERDADLARKMRGKLVAEVAELRGLRTREMESILAFVTRRFEEWIPKYREFSTSFPRRLMFIATTNEDEFLDGARKHRRWLPLKVAKFADVDAIRRDRKQLWAEAKLRFEADGLLYEKADKLGGAHREEFRIKGVWEDVIEDWLSTPDALDDKRPCDADFIRTVDVARFALNLDPSKMKRADEMKVADSMKALGFDSVRVWDDKDSKQIRAWVKPSD